MAYGLGLGILAVNLVEAALNVGIVPLFAEIAKVCTPRLGSFWGNERRLMATCFLKDRPAGPDEHMQRLPGFRSGPTPPFRVGRPCELKC